MTEIYLDFSMVLLLLKLAVCGHVDMRDGAKHLNILSREDIVLSALLQLGNNATTLSCFIHDF